MKRRLIRITSNKPVALWPPSWVRGETARTRRAPGAPRRAKVIPISCEETLASGVKVPAYFQLSTSLEIDRAVIDVDPSTRKGREIFQRLVDVGSPSVASFSSTRTHEITLLCMWEA